MSDAPVTPTEGSKRTILDNPSEWLDSKLKKDAEPTAQPEAVEVTPQPAVNPLDMRLPSDFEHGFFRDKPVSEMYKSYKESESAKQRAERERNELREANERLRADLAARDLAYRQAQEARPSAPKPDHLDEINDIWFSDPKLAAAKLREATLTEARAIAEQEAQKIRQETAEEKQKREYFDNGNKAYESAFSYLSQQSNGGLNRDTWNKRAKAVLMEITDPGSAYFNNGGPMNAENYVRAYQEIFGPVAVPAAATVAPPSPVAANPPGAKKAPTGAALPNGGLPTMSAELRGIQASFAGTLGIDPDKLGARVLNRKGK